MVALGAQASGGRPLFDVKKQDLVLNLSIEQSSRAVAAGELTAWNDTSGEGNHATIFNNAEWIGGVVGGYEGLDGALSPARYVRRTTLVGGAEAGPLWVAFPVTIDRDDSGNRALFDSGSSGNNFLILQQTAALRLSAGANLDAAAALPVGTHYVVCVVHPNGTDSRIYVNDMVTARNTGNAGTNDLIGYTAGAQNTGLSPFDGKLVEMIVGRGDPSQDLLNALGQRATAMFNIPTTTGSLVQWGGVLPPEPMYIVSVMGQSNGVGVFNGEAFQSPWAARFPLAVPMIGDVGGSSFGIVPLGQPNTNIGSFALSLLWRLSNAGIRCGLHWAAKGSTGLGAAAGGEWAPGSPGGTMWEIAKAKWNAFAPLIHTKVHPAVGWSQGEQDALDSVSANAYRSNHDALRAAWITLTGFDPSWQMVPNHLDFASAPVSLPFNGIVRGHQIDIGNLPPNGIATADGTVLIDQNISPSFTTPAYAVRDLIHHGNKAATQTPLGGGDPVLRTVRLEIGNTMADNLLIAA